MALRNRWALAIAILALTAPLVAHAQTVIKRGYVEYRYGQMHYAIATPTNATPTNAKALPLVMIHQTVNSALESPGFFQTMAQDRVVIAIDTPGVGGSDGPDVAPTIETYAAAIAEGLHRMGFGPARPVDVVGFHSGSLIAAEIAILEPRMVRHAALSGVYVVSEERWKKAIATLPTYKTSAEFFEWFVATIPLLRKSAAERGIPDADWGRALAESLRPLTKREFVHEAAFTYAARAKERLPKVTQPVLLLALGDGLRQPTLDSQPLFKNVTLADLPQYTDGAYFVDPGAIAAALRGFLDR